MYTIQVDFDVFKAITALRSSEDVTENDVLRDVLNLGPRKNASAPAQPSAALSSAPGDWVTKGVRFPSGTEFRATYKGQEYHGRVEGGALVVGTRRHDSPSDAARAITKTSVNGWTFWECRFPGTSSWVLITTLRK